MPTLNINGNIRTNTAAGWGADATVYTAKTILVTTDATYGATDQRKYKIADGTQTWSNLDYFPVSGYDDATSSIQTQLNGKQASGSYLTSANITQVITNGVTDKAPSEDAIFDALALKQAAGTYATGTGTANGTNTGDETGSSIGVLINGAGAVTLDDTDLFALAESSVLKKLTFANLKAALKPAAPSFFNTINHSIADSTSYFIGQLGSPSNSLALCSLVPIRAGNIVAVMYTVFSASTVGSNENGTLKLHYNDGASNATITSAIKVDANRQSYGMITGLSISVNDGGAAFEYAAPALATNPTAIRFVFVPIYG